MSTLYRPFDLIVRKADAFDVDLPETPLKKYRWLREILDRADEPPSTLELQAAIAAAVEAGDDPLSDPDVLELAARRELASGNVTHHLGEQARRLLIDNAVDLFAAFEPAFDRAADLLRDAHTALSSVDFRGAVPQPKPPAWDQAEVAERTITDIYNLWKILASSPCGAPFPYSPRYSTLVWTNPSPQQWFQLRPDTEHVRPWDAVAAGLPLSLATSPDIYRARIAALDAYKQEQAEAKARAEREQRARGRQSSRHLTLADAEAM